MEPHSYYENWSVVSQNPSHIHQTNKRSPNNLQLQANGALFLQTLDAI